MVVVSAFYCVQYLYKGEKVSEEEIVLRRFRRVKDPLKALVGKKPFPRHVPIEELEEKKEAR